VNVSTQIDRKCVEKIKSVPTYEPHLIPEARDEIFDKTIAAGNTINM